VLTLRRDRLGQSTTARDRPREGGERRVAMASNGRSFREPVYGERRRWSQPPEKAVADVGSLHASPSSPPEKHQPARTRWKQRLGVVADLWQRALLSSPRPACPSPNNAPSASAGLPRGNAPVSRTHVTCIVYVFPNPTGSGARSSTAKRSGPCRVPPGYVSTGFFVNSFIRTLCRTTLLHGLQEAKSSEIVGTL
jgi:hypothetical protein